MALRLVRLSPNLRIVSGLLQTRCMSDTAGSGAGKGGGTGGQIRDAGGAFGKREAALEEQYFRRKQEEQLQALRESMKDEISHHYKQIKEHEEAIKRHKAKIGKLDKMQEDD